jgi:hypothetical protein
MVKHREGKTGMLPMTWHPEFTRFDAAKRESTPRLIDEPATYSARKPDLHEINALLNE